MSLTEWTKFAPKPRELVSPFEWNVFLSYRSINRTWVLNLYDVLRQHGFKAFIDQCALKPGDELDLRLATALNNSQAGVLVWSDRTRDSQWVLREYQKLEALAMRQPSFHFVPVKLDDSELPGFGDNRIFVNFSSYPDGPNGGELLRLLYGLVGLPLSEEAAAFADRQDVASQEAANKIGAAIEIKDVAYILDLFKEGGLAWETSSALGCKAAEGLVRLDYNDKAIAMLEELGAQFQRAIRPKQLHALALARRGQGEDLNKAQRILAELYTQGERDPETLGIYARTWMDRYDKESDTSFLRKSRDLYAEAFSRAIDDYYTGINAAAKSVLLGESEDLVRASVYAERVQKIVGDKIHPGDYWKSATVAETFLLQQDFVTAGRLYKDAVATAPTETGSHKSSWKQACRLMDKLQPTDEQRAMIRGAFRDLPDCIGQ